mmetsp:Transcript_11750/g.19164  ORF Transcript_11750/g.19164 Transcript_11750/m.19164 type:complete len:99 (+) Transcript_11750:363-659(+)
MPRGMRCLLPSLHLLSPCWGVFMVLFSFEEVAAEKTRLPTNKKTTTPCCPTQTTHHSPCTTTTYNYKSTIYYKTTPSSDHHLNKHHLQDSTISTYTPT